MAALFSLSLITEKLPFFCYTKPERLFSQKRFMSVIQTIHMC
ncbi:hypothetical protein CHCC20375_0913 [Bacillus licheniformis]|nr:hypothetical protein CHCC20375_0913 [Bacillus licheniformis]